MKFLNRFTEPRSSISGNSYFQTGQKTYCQKDDELSSFTWPDRNYWVIARELVLFHTIDLSEVPVALRYRVIDQKLQQLSPFSELGKFCHIEGSLAMVWFWDEDLRQVQIAAAKELVNSDLPGELPVIPESVLQPKIEFGCVVRRGHSGFDLQAWKSGCLVESCWSETASETAIIEFARLTRNNDSIGSIPTTGDYQSTAWSEHVGSLADLVKEKALIRSGLYILSLAVVFYLGQWTGWQVEIISMQSQIESKQSEVNPVLQKRQEVISLREQNRLLKTWFDTPGLLQIMAEFDRSLTSTTLEILEWQYQGQELRVTISDPAADNRQIVEDLSANSLFNQVRIEPGIRDDIVVVAGVKF